MNKRVLAGVLLGLAVACSSSGAEDVEGTGEGEGHGAAAGAASSSSGGLPSEPQPWVEILEPGQSFEDEAADADGWCAGAEGAVPCDDGADAGSGGVPPPGWTSSSSGGGNNGNTSSGGGGDNGNTSSGGASSGMPPICNSEQFTTGQAVKPQVLLVVDKSGSMDEEPSGQNQTKWEQAVDVLQTVTAQLESGIDFGLALFPAGGNNSCSPGNVVVNVGVNRADEIANALDNAGPGGGTPTGPSLEEALSYLRNLDGERPRAVVVATDGAPNCTEGYDPDTCVCTNGNSQCDDSRNCLDRDGAVSAAEALADEGISTFVVGIPGTDAYANVLNEMAVAAGTALPPGGPRYYRTTDAQSLHDAMDAIGTRLSTCRFTLAQDVEPTQPVVVSVDGTSVGRDSGHVNGFDVIGGNTIELFGAQCDALADGSNHAVTVTYCFYPGG